MIHALDKTQNLAKEMQTELLCTRAANCPAHCLCSCSCGFLERLTLPPNGVLLILIPGVFFDRLEGYFVEDQFVGETSLANLAAAEASSEEDQSSK